MMFPKPTKKEKTPKVLRARTTPKDQKTVKGDATTYHDPELLAYVRTLPCAGLRCAELGCDRAPGGSEAHHVMTGTGHRRGVDLAVPLSRVCHEHYTRHPAEEPRYWQWWALGLWESFYGENFLRVALRAVIDALD